jgi:hypothetical protein
MPSSDVCSCAAATVKRISTKARWLSGRGGVLCTGRFDILREAERRLKSSDGNADASGSILESSSAAIAVQHSRLCTIAVCAVRMRCTQDSAAATDAGLKVAVLRGVAASVSRTISSRSNSTNKSSAPRLSSARASAAWMRPTSSRVRERGSSVGGVEGCFVPLSSCGHDGYPSGGGLRAEGCGTTRAREASATLRWLGLEGLLTTPRWADGRLSDACMSKNCM